MEPGDEPTQLVRRLGGELHGDLAGGEEPGREPLGQVLEGIRGVGQVFGHDRDRLDARGGGDELDEPANRGVASNPASSDR